MQGPSQSGTDAVSQTSSVFLFSKSIWYLAVSVPYLRFSPLNFVSVCIVRTDWYTSPEWFLIIITGLNQLRCGNLVWGSLGYRIDIPPSDLAIFPSVSQDSGHMQKHTQNTVFGLIVIILSGQNARIMSHC